MESGCRGGTRTDLPQVHGERLEHHAEVGLVEEVPEQPQAVVAVVGVSVVQLFQRLQLLETRLVPAEEGNMMATVISGL